MARFGFLLRPQWLALYVVVLGFAYLCFTVLAPWQLGKNTKTSRENDQISSSLSEAPVPVTSILPHQDSSAPGQRWRQVTATGRYQPERQVLDTLVAAGVARSRSEALAWCVRLVGEHTDSWLTDLREAMGAVDRLRAQGPDAAEPESGTES